MEAAMLASIFDQSVMDLSKPINGNLADNRALPAMVLHTKDDNTHQFLPMEDGRRREKPCKRINIRASETEASRSIAKRANSLQLD